MASRKLTEEDLAEIQALAKGWGKVVARRAFGEDGPGLDVDLDALEQVAVAAARGLTAGTLEEATAKQAQRLGQQQPCPSCGQPCPVRQEGRPVVVRGGEFLHPEPVCYCTA